MKEVDSLAALGSFHAALIRDARLGPRRELTLDIETFPKFKQGGKESKMVVIRFSAISNYQEVKQLFAKPHFASLHYLREANRSGPNRIFEMEFDSTEEKVRIMAGKITVQV